VLRAHRRHVNDFAFDQLDGGFPVQQAYFGHPVIFFGSESMSMRPSLDVARSHDFPRKQTKGPERTLVARSRQVNTSPASDAASLVAMFDMRRDAGKIGISGPSYGTGDA
jgi:hypothetical protein